MQEVMIKNNLSDKIVGKFGDVSVKMLNAKANTIFSPKKPFVSKITIVDGEMDASLFQDARKIDATAHASNIATKLYKVVESYIGQPNTLKTHTSITAAIEAEVGLRVQGAEIIDGQVGKDDNGKVNIGVIIRQPPYIKELKCHFVLGDSSYSEPVEPIEYKKPKVERAVTW